MNLQSEVSLGLTGAILQGLVKVKCQLSSEKMSLVISMKDFYGQ